MLAGNFTPAANLYQPAMKPMDARIDQEDEP
jgi:hypothetical protein